MSDPFAFLNPIASTKSSTEKVPTQSHHPSIGVSPSPVAPMSFGMGMMSTPNNNNNMGMGMNMGMGAPLPVNGGGMNMNMGGAPYGMMPSAFPGMSGLGHGMNPPNPYGQQQPPVIYDNIKKLLEKKPVVDDASMDFLEGLGGGAKMPSNSSTETSKAFEPMSNPFGAPQASAKLDLSFLGDAPTSANAVQPASPASGSKSSALASRLAHGKRLTQEAARKNLGFNAGSFTSTGQSAKISLKTVADGPTSSAATSEPTVDDFVAGNAVLPAVDDIFAATPTYSPANTTSNSNDIFW